MTSPYRVLILEQHSAGFDQKDGMKACEAVGMKMESIRMRRKTDVVPLTRLLRKSSMHRILSLPEDVVCSTPKRRVRGLDDVDECSKL